MEKEEHKLFISHSSKDKEYANSIVAMLKDIGVPDKSIICTSVPGYGIPGGAKIYDWLQEQFLNYNIRVLYVLSHNYYNSPACLNEMGAAWVTKATDTILLLPGFKFKDIQGCIDSQELGISFECDNTEIQHRLNEFKDILIKEYSLSDKESIIWENCRNNFIKIIQDIAQENITFDRNMDTNSNVNDAKRYTPTSDWNNKDNFSLESAFLLVYAAAEDGSIIKYTVLNRPIQVQTSKNVFMSDDKSERESARWQDALEWIVAKNYAKEVGNKGEIFKLTYQGYKIADMLKDRMQIDTDVDALTELKNFE